MGRRLSTWAAVGALGLVVAACGSSGDDDDGATEAIAPASSAEEAAPVTTTAAAAADEAAAPASTTAPAISPASSGDESADSWCPVSTEQVSDVVHHPMVEGQPCTWTAPDLTTAVLEVYVSGTDAAHLAGSTATVTGVGDAAAFDVSDALVFEQDDTYWVVQILNIGGGSDVASKDAEVELAQLVLAG